MIEAARNRIAAAGYSDVVTLEQADLTVLQLPDASYDHVFSWGVVIHIPPPGTYAALENLARVVRKGGRLALYLVNKSAVDNKIEYLARAITGRKFERQTYDIGRGAFYDMHGERLWVWRFDHAGLTGFLEKMGLKLVRRVGGEFSELQRRAPKALRPALLHFNNLSYSLKLPPQLAITNLWIFEKE
jgi:ubiquinone/menaquinone biosynthesis C-methylase UbiE